MSEDLSLAADDAWQQPVVGVIGGNGPAATALLLDVVVRRTPATTDQEHLDLLVLDHSSQPDRTARILDESAPDPGPVLARDARRLEAWGCAFVAIPCNTANHFLPRLREQVRIPIVSIVDATAEAALERGRRIGVLATDGTRAAKVYDRAVESRGGTVVLPDDDDQKLVMSVIYDGVKAGGDIDVEGLDAVITRMSEDCDAVVLGCTELSVVYDQQGWASRPELVDSIDSLACAIVREAGREPRV